MSDGNSLLKKLESGLNIGDRADRFVSAVTDSSEVSIESDRDKLVEIEMLARNFFHHMMDELVVGVSSDADDSEEDGEMGEGDSYDYPQLFSKSGGLDEAATKKVINKYFDDNAKFLETDAGYNGTQMREFYQALSEASLNGGKEYFALNDVDDIARPIFELIKKEISRRANV